MNYAKPLPNTEDFKRLSKAVGKFPVNTQQVIRIAETSGYENDTIEFLKLFKGKFESRADFYARTSELAMLIQEEKKLPEEKTLSPQD